MILSLPSRERGLKFFYRDKLPKFRNGSLPSRERGLKLLKSGEKETRKVSLPSRERGLKS